MACPVILKDDSGLYNVGDGVRLPSVTTILDKITDKTAINEWIARIGPEAAEEQTSKACISGHIIHSEIAEALEKERWVRNDLITAAQNAITYMMLTKLTEVVKLGYLLSEQPVVCRSEGYAGTPDLVAFVEYHGELSLAVIDYKTYRKHKHGYMLDSVKCQLAMYAKAIQETYNETPVVGVVLQGNADQGVDCQMFDLTEYQELPSLCMAKYREITQ